jgi:hypothetical protein
MPQKRALNHVGSYIESFYGFQQVSEVSSADEVVQVTALRQVAGMNLAGGA